MYWIGSTYIGKSLYEGTITYTPPAVLPTDRWRINWYHRSGGLKKSWYLGQDNCFISRIQFENNLKGCGAGTISLGYITFPIDPDDYVRIYFKGTAIYWGIVEVKPDAKGNGDVQLIPLWQRLQERMFAAGKTNGYKFGTGGDHAAAKVFDILKTVMTDGTYGVSSTGILWDDAKVTDDNATLYSATYNNEFAYKIIDDLVTGRLTNKYWGVDENGYFFVKAFDSSVTTTLFYIDSPAYGSVEITTDYSGILATRYQVYGKTAGASGTSLLGQVGYGAPYAVLPIENTFRRKEERITVPDILASADALSWAYAQLQSYVPIQCVKVHDVQLDSYQPTIGKMISVQDSDDTIMYTAASCDSVNGWSGTVTLDTSDFVEGTGCVYFPVTKIGDYMEYSFGNILYVNNLQLVGLMIKSTQASGTFMSIYIYYGFNDISDSYSEGTYSGGDYSFGDETGTGVTESMSATSMNITAAGIWQYSDAPINTSISRIRIICTSTPNNTTGYVKIDRIQFFCNYRTVYNQNVVQVNYDITPENENCEVQLQTYDQIANKQIIYFDKKLKAMETSISSN